MSTTTILLTIYIASVVSLLLFMVIQKVRGKSTMKVKENLGMTIAALILAPISWILGIIVGVVACGNVCCCISLSHSTIGCSCFILV